jgi:hypothetical protein
MNLTFSLQLGNDQAMHVPPHDGVNATVAQGESAHPERGRASPIWLDVALNVFSALAKSACARASVET